MTFAALCKALRRELPKGWRCYFFISGDIEKTGLSDVKWNICFRPKDTRSHKYTQCKKHGGERARSVSATTVHAVLVKARILIKRMQQQAELNKIKPTKAVETVQQLPDF